VQFGEFHAEIELWSKLNGKREVNVPLSMKTWINAMKEKEAQISL